MSDATLLAFGCAVSFIALGGVYVYLLQCFTEQETSETVEVSGERRAKDGEGMPLPEHKLQES